MSEILLSGLICILVGISIGWTEAHRKVSTECQNLGSFYVEKKVYECKHKEKNT